MRKIITLILLILVYSGYAQTKEIDSLYIQLAFEESDTLKVDTSLKLIKNLYDIEDYDKALKYIYESEKLSSAMKYTYGIAEITYYKSLIYANKNDYINAVTGYAKSKALFSELKDTLGIAKVNNSIGLIEIQRGNYTKGLQYSLSAIKELEKRNLKPELCLAYENLAKAYYNINAQEKAVEFYTKTLPLQKQLNKTEGLIETHIRLAELYSGKKEYRKSIEYYETVLELAGASNDSIRASILPKLGGEYLKFNDFDRASTYLDQGLILNRRTKNKLGLTISLNNLGALNLSQKKLILAEQQLLEAGLLAKSINHKAELLRYYKLMKDLDSTKKKFDRAYVWQREYYDLKNSLEKKKTGKDTLTEATLELNPNFNEDVLEDKPTDTKSSILLKDENNRFQLIFYALLGALAIVSTFLVLIYLKRNNSIKYMQELEEKNIKIELQNKAFQEQTKHLENVNNVKDKLFSIISHDLKDSLSSINGFIDLLKDGSLTREEFENLVPELSENANNASLLLFNLLNWSKSQMHSLEPKPTLFDVQEVFEDKIKLIEQRLENKGIDLIDHSLRDFVYADRSMFEIVVQNLLANAVKFCKNGDSITISNHISNGSCIISIADTGIGISKENIEKLFKNNSFTTIGTSNEKG
ncbi:MAG: sensor histidine kinase, partial [Flavobacteriales bacterium]|nr:sensor histidine kinase [Flavobacteriales bacterium]